MRIYMSSLPYALHWLICGILGTILSSIHFAAFAPSQAFVILSSYAAYSRQYEIGSVYSFGYETSVLLNEPQAAPISSPKDVGFMVDLHVELSPIWQNPTNANEQIMEMKVTIPKLSVKARQGPTPTSFVNKPSKADSYESLPFYLHREGGFVKKVFYTNKEQLSWINIKKGIANLFQYQVKDGLESETDASGRCDVTYKLTGKTHLQKVKTNCRTIEPVPFFNHTHKVLGAVVLSQSATMYELIPEDGSIKLCSSVETHLLRPEARKSVGVEVIGRQVLKLKGKSQSKSKKYKENTVSKVVTSISKVLRSTLIAENLSTVPDPKECIACKSLKDLVTNFRKSLSPSNLATQSSGIAFLRLLGKMRESDSEKIKAVLSDKKNLNVLPQLLDIVAATQTIPAHNAAMSILNFQGKIELPERYLLALSLNTHPLEFVIEDLFKVAKKGLKDNFLSETLILTIASMTRTFANVTKNANQQVISNVRHFIVNELENCENENCQLKYIRALKNLQCRSTIPTLLKFSKSKSRKASIYAMRAIQTMPNEYLDSKIIKELEDILFELDSLHDSSVRAMSAEILLRRKPDETLLKDIFQLLKDQNEKELNTLLLGHIRDLCEKNPQIDELVQNVLRDSRLGNYHTLGQSGLSSAFSRPFSKDSNVNTSFSNMLEISGGILKRSNVDVFVDAEDARLRLLSFGMFAGGLSMFAGDESESKEDDDDANAGIEISLMDTQLRPYVFFNGQGELMGHVWSGTASERTTALQGSVLLQDHSQIVPLQNGLNVELQLTGVVSYDFAGQIQISLWNRNAHSLVEVRAAVVVQGQARVDNSFVQTMIEFNVGAQSQLNLISDLEFYDDITMCLQMVQPNFQVVHNLRKLERIPGSNYVLRKYKRRSSDVPGKTYVMNRKNTELCNKMFKN